MSKNNPTEMDFKSFIYECDLSSLDNGIVSEQPTLKLKMFVANDLQRNCVSEQNSFASKLHFILAEHPFKLSLSHTLPYPHKPVLVISVWRKKKASGVEKTSVLT